LPIAFSGAPDALLPLAVRELGVTIDNTLLGLILFVVVVLAFLVGCIWRLYTARDPDRDTLE